MVRERMVSENTKTGVFMESYQLKAIQERAELEKKKQRL